MKLEQFIKSAGITMTATSADSNPNMDDDKMDHWRCVLRCGKSRMTVPFSMGVGHNGKAPDVAGVLECLASDSTTAEECFESWCSELGYDADSRTAERTYNTCRKQAKRLEAFLGSSAYKTLLWETER